MRLHSRLHWPRDSAKREHGIRQCIVEMKVGRIPPRIAGVFDRYQMGRRILTVEESRDTEDAVAIGASWVAAEGKGELLERRFLTIRVETFDMPENLIFAG